MPSQRSLTACTHIRIRIRTHAPKALLSPRKLLLPPRSAARPGLGSPGRKGVQSRTSIVIVVATATTMNEKAADPAGTTDMRT